MVPVLWISILPLHLIIQQLLTNPSIAGWAAVQPLAVSLIQSAGQKLSLVVQLSRCRFLSLPFQARPAARCCPFLSWGTHPKFYQDWWQHWSKQRVGHCPAWTELNTPGIRHDSTDGELEMISKAARSEHFHVLAFTSVSHITLSPNTSSSSGNRVYLRF